MAPRPLNPNTASYLDTHMYLESLSAGEREMVERLLAKVEDWKGHRVCTFGSPLLFDRLTISKIRKNNPYTRSIHHYRVALFANILLCCRKQAERNHFGQDYSLKGRIFTRNITSIRVQEDWRLRIEFNGGDGSEVFTIEFDRRSTLEQWQVALRAVTLARVWAAPPYDQSLSLYMPLPSYDAASYLAAPTMERTPPQTSSISISSAAPVYPLDHITKHSATDALPFPPNLLSALSASSVYEASPRLENGEVAEVKEKLESYAYTGHGHARALKRSSRFAVAAVTLCLVCGLSHYYFSHDLLC